MKMKIWKRLVFFALALVLAAGVLPMMSFMAEAATTSTSHYGFTATIEPTDPYFRPVQTKIDKISITNGTAEIELFYQLYSDGNHNFRSILTIPDYSCEKEIYIEKLNDQKIADVTLTRSAGHYCEDWQSAADGKHTGTCKVCGQTALEDHEYTNDCDTSCNICGNTRTIEHSYQYSASENTITETCVKGCGHTAKAELTAANAYYTGSAIAAASIAYGEGWAGDKKQPADIADTVYTDNTNVGTATVTTTVEGKTLTTSFKISYLPGLAAEALRINGGYVKDGVNWFGGQSSANILPPDRYTISTALDGTYGSNISLRPNDSKKVYLQRESDDAKTDAIDLSDILKWDSTAPAGRIYINFLNGQYESVNAADTSFSIFTKEQLNVSITASDDDSGVQKIEYYVATDEQENPANLSYQPYTTEIPLGQGKHIVYARITDNVGNVSYLNTNGIVVYQDSAVDTMMLMYPYYANEERKIDIDFNRNKVNTVLVNGSQPDFEDYYEVTSDGITLNAGWLHSLNAGEYTITITFDPQGVLVGSNAVGDMPNTSDVQLIVNKAPLKVTVGNKTVTYGDAVPEYEITAEGFKSNESLDEISKDAVFFCDYVQGSAAGTYPVSISGLFAPNYDITVVDGTLTVNQKELTIYAKDQTVAFGADLSNTAFTTEGLIDGHSVKVLMIPSTSNVTINGTVIPSAAVITADGIDVTKNYSILLWPGKLVIEPDTSKINALTTENVTSANEEDIKEVKAMIAAGDAAAKKKWSAITEKCEELLEKLAEIAAENDRIMDAAAVFDKDTVKSSDKKALTQLSVDIEKLLDTKNLTMDEQAALKEALVQVEELIGTIEETAADIKAVMDTIDALDIASVHYDDGETIAQAINAIAVILDSDNLTAEERDELKASIAEAEALLQRIGDSLDAVNTESVEDTLGTTAANVQLDEKTDIQQAIKTIQAALDTYAGNYSASDKKELQDQIALLQGALKSIEAVEAVLESVEKLPETVEPDDEAAGEKILAAKKSYDALTTHEKSLVGETAKKTLDALVAALTDYDIVKGDGGNWIPGTNGSLSFTANGPYKKFVGIEVDGEEVAEKYYKAKAGSTIITLKESFLKKLSVGEHTITVVYTDGKTYAAFKTQAEVTTPATGDDFNVMLYGSMFTMSLAALAVLLLASKKRKQENT